MTETITKKQKMELNSFEQQEEYTYQPQKLDYRNKVVLAPMVRAGHLEFRLLCLEYGADIVWSEELIGFKMRKTKRCYNPTLGTVDFLYKSKENGKRTSPEYVFRTCKRDHPNVLQLGVADPVVALEAAQIVSRDVDGIDINSGCPKHFSVHAGMGAALMEKPETIKDIITTLKRNIPNSVSIKIRLHQSVPDTLHLMKAIESTGVDAITVHGRYRSERPTQPAHWDQLLQIAQSDLQVPLIFNGDVYQHEDIAKMRSQTSISSVMIARGALANPCVFSPTLVRFDQTMKRYLELCLEFRSPFKFAHYTVERCESENIHRYGKATWHKTQKVISGAKSMQSLSQLFNLETPSDWKTVEQIWVDNPQDDIFLGQIYDPKEEEILSEEGR